MRRPLCADCVMVVCLSAVTAAFLSGCVSTVYNYTPETIEISEPRLNTVVTAQVGDNMVRQGRYAEHDGIYLREDVKVGILGEVTITRGSYLKVGEDAKSEFYRPGGPEPGQIRVHPAADPVEAIRIPKKGGKFCAVTTTKMEDCTTGANYERKKYPVTSTDLFQQTLIYSGKVADKINVAYREFSNNLARPGFNNDVEYDLSESNVIGYKGARIEVLEATNEYIKYKVISNFNKAEY